MTHTLEQLADKPVLICAPTGAPVRGERDATDLIGEVIGHGAVWVALPASRLTEEFFQLRTRVAGGIVQKFASYRVGLAVIGDFSRFTRAGSALEDFIRESNRGTQLWFLPTIDTLRTRLEEL